MTRDERLEVRWQRVVARMQHRLAASQKDRAAKRALVGKLAEQAGLCAWSARDLQACFAVLARLADTPNPGAVLEGLLDASLTGPLVPGNGYATAAQRVPSGAGMGSEAP